jgi:hypothetical protein
MTSLAATHEAYGSDCKHGNNNTNVKKLGELDFHGLSHPCRRGGDPSDTVYTAQRIWLHNISNCSPTAPCRQLSDGHLFRANQIYHKLDPISSVYRPNRLPVQGHGSQLPDTCVAETTRAQNHDNIPRPCLFVPLFFEDLGEEVGHVCP